jgi:hypothetical protein
MSPRAGRDTLSPRERVGVREPGSTLAMACMGRFMESPTIHESRMGTMNRDSGGRDAPLYGRRDARRYGGALGEHQPILTSPMHSRDATQARAMATTGLHGWTIRKSRARSFGEKLSR